MKLSAAQMRYVAGLHDWLSPGSLIIALGYRYSFKAAEKMRVRLDVLVAAGRLEHRSVAGAAHQYRAIRAGE